MASVHLSFVAPSRDDLVSLLIYESPTKDAVGALIETVTDIGSPKNYIREYTTDLATASNDWFRIQWEDSKGGVTDISEAVQGGTDTVVGQVVDRVLERAPSLGYEIVKQESEGAIQEYYGDATDPYDVTLDPSYRILNGLTYLVLARSSLATAVVEGAAAVDSATIGLVTLRSGSSSSSATKVDYGALFDMAFDMLGMQSSVVLQMERIEKIYGGPAWATINGGVVAVIEP